jgi:hypothetical protein
MGGVRRRSQAINKAKGPSERVAFLIACVIQSRANDSLLLSHQLNFILGLLKNHPFKGFKVDNAMLGCENAVQFFRTSAVEYLLGRRINEWKRLKRRLHAW